MLRLGRNAEVLSDVENAIARLSAGEMSIAAFVDFVKIPMEELREQDEVNRSLITNLLEENVRYNPGWRDNQ